MTATLASVSLAHVGTGAAARIVAIADEDLGALAEVGLFEQSLITVERRRPLGGPVLLDSGAARIAIARAVAARTRVIPER